MKIKIYDANLIERIYVKKTLKTANRMLNQPDKLEISVSFVNGEDIKKLNEKFRGADKITDVLSFPLLEIKAGTAVSPEENSVDVDKTTGRLSLGDVVICREKAASQAKEYGHGYKREVCFLALHGYLHLLGYDHAEENDRKTMERVQDEILAFAGMEREKE